MAVTDKQEEEEQVPAMPVQVAAPMQAPAPALVRVPVPARAPARAHVCAPELYSADD